MPSSVREDRTMHVLAVSWHAKHAHNMCCRFAIRGVAAPYPYLHQNVRLGEVFPTSPSQSSAFHDALYVPKGALCRCRVVRLRSALEIVLTATLLPSMLWTVYSCITESASFFRVGQRSMSETTPRPHVRRL